ncbi:MAG TPA: hypothetical protein VKC89_02325 [Patescibacteria group bacterium]|nr:hypothetical protein [Patescibacteria group bacterium]
MKKFIFITFLLLISLVGFFAYQKFKFDDGKLHIIFCNVGQGDGIFIRSPKGIDIMVDSGPDDSILRCLSSHMPFWDREIELAFLTHPHEDHMKGYEHVFKRYKVLSFNTEELSNKTLTYKAIINDIQNLKIKTRSVFQGDSFKLPDNLQIKVVGPSREFLNETSPHGEIGESGEFGSLELLFSYKSFSVLTTGDSQVREILNAQPYLQNLTVFQIPHHGSRFGIDKENLIKLNPKLAVISVGKNKYGHPTKEVLQDLEDSKINYLRTDKRGDIEIVVDSKGNYTLR